MRAIAEAASLEQFQNITAITKPQIRQLLRDGGPFEENTCEVACDRVRYILRAIRCGKGDGQRREEKLAEVRKLAEEKTVYLAKHPKAQIKVVQRKIGEKIAHLQATGWIMVISHERALKLVIEIGIIEEYNFPK